jgi:alpha-tubulin suppressor-like RCC1 family protein
MLKRTLSLGLYCLLLVSVAAAQQDSITAWGSDSSGQVSNTPSGLDFVQIAGGEQHSLALHSNGSIVSWGFDQYGQVSNTPPGTDFIQVASGAHHSLALHADGTIETWGRNSYGQVSNAPSGPGFVQVVGGREHSLALHSDGSIHGWGGNTYGQASPPSGTDFVQVAAGLYHSFALRSDGTIVSWGYDQAGQVSDTPSGLGYIQVAGGSDHSLALHSDGSIVSWGSGSYGLIADTPLGNNYVQVAAGYLHSLALDSNGSIVSWGWDDSGQVSETPLGAGYGQVVGGWKHSTAMLGIDSDADGLIDRVEDSNNNGQVDPGESDPFDQDSDDDGLSDGEETAVPDPGLTWYFNPDTNHFYALVDNKTLYEAEFIANKFEGHVVTVNDLNESSWLATTFASYIGGGPHIVLGYYQDRDDPNYSEPDGGWKWISGETPAFTAWQINEPNNLGGSQDRANMVVAQGLESWDDGAMPFDRGLYALEAPFDSVPPKSNPLLWDSDGDGLSDGLESGLDTIYWDGHGIPGVSGTDPGVFVPDADPLTTTDPLDLDSDDDGLADDVEDLDLNGAAGPGETDASRADTDGDSLPDGLELGLAFGIPDTDLNVFTPDLDPLTTTDPLSSDTDGGGLDDGDEDFNRDGAFNYVEFDPNVPGDDRFNLQVSNLIPGQQATLSLSGHRAGSTVAVVYSLTGLGLTSTPFGFDLEILAPLTTLPAQVVFTSSSVQYADVPISAPAGLDIWFQSVEKLFFGDLFRMTQVLHAQTQ